VVIKNVSTSLFHLIEMSSVVIFPPNLLNLDVVSTPFLSGPANYEIVNSSVQYVANPDSSYCSAKTLTLNPISENSLLMIDNLKIGCYPEDIAVAAESRGFVGVGVVADSHPFGIRAGYLWKSDVSPIPLVEIKGLSSLVLKQNNDIFVSLYPANNQWVSSSSFKASIRSWGAVIAFVSLVKFALCVQRVAGNITSLNRKKILTPLVAISSLEMIASMCSFVHFAIDPWGFAHLLPYPIMRLLVFGTSNITILTTFLVSRTFHRVVLNIKQTSLNDQVPVLFVVGFIIADFVILVLDLSRTGGLVASFSIISVSVDLTFLSIFALYYMLFKFRVVMVLNRYFFASL
jgi:hypothetical protein